MNKEQAKELYERVQINWGVKGVTPTQKKAALEVWWRYLGGLVYESASRAIDARALAGGFPPRPAEIFTDVYVTGQMAPPSAAQALVDSKRLTEAIQHGTEIPQVHPLISQTLADVGVQRDDVFQKLYEERRRQALSDLLDPYLSPTVPT